MSRKFSYRPHRRNWGGALAAALNPPAGEIGVLSGVQPRNLVAVLPILGGAIANGYIRGQLLPSLGFMPNIVKKGIGNYAVGVATSGIIGAIAGYFDPAIGRSMFVGGISETAISAFAESYAGFKSSGVTGIIDPLKPNLSGLSGSELEGCGPLGCAGMGGVQLDDAFNLGDFVSTPQIQAPLQMPSASHPMIPTAQNAAQPVYATTNAADSAVLSEMIMQ